MIVNIQETVNGFTFYMNDDDEDEKYKYIAKAIATVYLSIFPPSFKLKRTNGYNYVFIEIYGRTKGLHANFEVIPTRNSHKDMTAEQYSEYLQCINEQLANEYHGDIHPDIWM